MGIIAGYPYRDGSTVEVSIDGDQRFTLYTGGENAWSYPEDQAQLIAAMRAGIDMVVKGTSSRGTLTTDTYSLRGFTATKAGDRRRLRALRFPPFPRPRAVAISCGVMGIDSHASIFAPPPRADGKLNLAGLDRAELAAAVEGMGEKPFRARQLWRWIYRAGVTDFDAMTDPRQAVPRPAEGSVRP